MRRRYFFFSDPHFGHENIIHYCNRPFEDANEMNEAIVKNYNYLVQPNDICFWLGDIGFYEFDKCKDLISRMNGTKILILGNHDKWGITSYYNLGFSAVLQNATIMLGKRQITLNHTPQRTLLEFIRICILYIKKMKSKKRTWKMVIQRIKGEWKRYLKSSKNWCICGHVHEKWKIRGKNINVGVDVWEFKPVHQDEILRILNQND